MSFELCPVQMTGHGFILFGTFAQKNLPGERANHGKFMAGPVPSLSLIVDWEMSGKCGDGRGNLKVSRTTPGLGVFSRPPYFVKGLRGLRLTMTWVIAATPAPYFVTGGRSSPAKVLLTMRRRCGSRRIADGVRCDGSSMRELRTCRNCKAQFDPLLNHPKACRFHTAHFGGETRRKFESVYSGGTMDTPDSGRIFQYWHCCGSEDPFDPGCTAAPHSSYDE